VNIFSNYSLIKSLNSYNYSNTYNSFKQITSLNYIVASFSGYIVVDSGLNKIIKFNQNFSYVTSKSNPNPKFIVSANNYGSIEIFVSTLYGVYKFDNSLSPMGYYYRVYYLNNIYFNNQFNGLYYNQTGDYILASTNAYFIEFLRRDDLTFIKYISTKPYIPTDIREFNGTLYVGTTGNAVLVIKNDIISSMFNTSCSTITSIAIDIFGNIAIICSSFIHLYSTNGTYLNVTLTSPVGNITSIGFDSYGNFIVTVSDGIFILH
jgi:hypothetical protein